MVSDQIAAAKVALPPDSADLGRLREGPLRVNCSRMIAVARTARNRRYYFALQPSHIEWQLPTTAVIQPLINLRSGGSYHKLETATSDNRLLSA
jgi:hypothetical protein